MPRNAYGGVGTGVPHAPEPVFHPYPKISPGRLRIAGKKPIMNLRTVIVGFSRYVHEPKKWRKNLHRMVSCNAIFL